MLLPPLHHQYLYSCPQFPELHKEEVCHQPLDILQRWMTILFSPRYFPRWTYFWMVIIFIVRFWCVTGSGLWYQFANHLPGQHFVMVQAWMWNKTKIFYGILWCLWPPVGTCIHTVNGIYISTTWLTLGPLAPDWCHVGYFLINYTSGFPIHGSVAKPCTFSELITPSIWRCEFNIKFHGYFISLLTPYWTLNWYI